METEREQKRVGNEEEQKWMGEAVGGGEGLEELGDTWSSFCTLIQCERGRERK